MSLTEKLHKLSLHVLTLCGTGALVSLAVNISTALVLFVLYRKAKNTEPK